MRLMADSINAVNIQTLMQHMSIDFAAGYVNGIWPSYYSLPNGPRHLSITVNSKSSAQIFDYEKGDFLAEDYPDCYKMNPEHTIYASRSMYAEIQKVSSLYKVPLLPWWAAVPGQAELYPGSIATQYGKEYGCDLSVVADYWPFVDSYREDDEMALRRDNKTGRIYLQTSDGHLWWIPDASPDLVNLRTQHGKEQDYTPNFLKQFPGYIS